MPPSGPPDRPSKRKQNSAVKFVAKRTKPARPALEERDQQVNQLRDEADDADAIQNAAMNAPAAAAAAAARAAALLQGQENGGAVIPVAANVEANAADDVDDAGADGAQEEVDDTIEWISDDKLPAADYWPVRLLKNLTAKATLEDKEERAKASVLNRPYDEDTLSCRYVVNNDEWHSMRIYKSVMKDDVNFKPGDFVSIRPTRDHAKGYIKIPHEDEKEKILTMRNDWVARIIQIRADGPHKACALVAWLYWPEDLYTAWSKGEKKAKTGRKNYHGDYELIASNHLDIMDIHSIDNNLNHLIERDYEDVESDGVIKECYYRQFYEYRTGKLSELKRYCGCNKYNKPDQPLIQCTNPACETWNHQACLIHLSVSKKFTELSRSDPSFRSKKGAKSTIPPNDINSVHINDRRYRDHLHGKLLPKVNQVQVTQIRRNIVTNVPIQCLKCGRTFI